MKKLLLLIILGVGAWFGGKRFLEKRNEAAMTRMEAADVREGMTVGDLRKALGEPASGDKGLSWGGGIVTATVASTDDMAEPTSIRMSAQYPGLIRGRPIDEFTRNVGVVRGKSTWTEVASVAGGGDEKWFVVWENDGTPQRGLVSVALTRAKP